MVPWAGSWAGDLPDVAWRVLEMSMLDFRSGGGQWSREPALTSGATLASSPRARFPQLGRLQVQYSVVHGTLALPG